MGMTGSSSHLGMTHSLFMSPQLDTPPRSPSHSMVSLFYILNCRNEVNELNELNESNGHQQALISFKLDRI